MTLTSASSTDQTKTILITGATGGIGRANAARFAEEGFNIILLGRSKEKLELIYEELEKSNPWKNTYSSF